MVFPLIYFKDMADIIINEKEREKKGLPKVKFSSRGNMYTTPKEIISSKQGRNVIEKLSVIKVEKKRRASNQEVKSEEDSK